MMRRRTFRHAFRATGAMAMFTAALTAAFYLTAFLYDRIGAHPPAPLALIINTVLGMLLTVLGVTIFGLLFRRRSRGPFAPITDALERIATGDFTIRLDEDGPRGAVGELVHTVNHMAGKLDQMEKMRREFVSNVSHEIQSPLTSIRGFACALRQDNLSAGDRQHYLEIIEAESLRLSRLSANLLKLASLESDQVRVEPKPYRLDTQIQNLILACETQWAEKQLEIDASLEEAGITADEDLLSQVWINLIHNSIKFTAAGGNVRIALRQRAERLIVSIVDTGIGIAEADQPRIFERFYKADRARCSSVGGNGLGLAIARRVVELHRGTIVVRSQPGAGAEFIVELPVHSLPGPAPASV